MAEPKVGPPKTAKGLRAEQLCKEYPTVANRTLAKRLHDEHGGSLDGCRSLIRMNRGLIGKPSKSKATAPKKRGKAGTVPRCPPSRAEPWLPFDIGNDIEVAIISDTHIPFHSEIALTAAVLYAKSRQPDVLLLNGDIGDFYEMSKWQKNPKKRDFKIELKLLREFFEWVRYEFPKARIVYKLGNHDERWEKWLWNHAIEISDMPEMDISTWVHAEKHGIEVIGEQRPVMCGQLPVMHGHELGRSGIANPVNPARGAFLRTHHTVLIGHSHQTSGHADTNIWHDETFVWSTGCLCDMTPEYARINRWNHGMAYCTVSHDGSFNVENLRISKDGKVRAS